METLPKNEHSADSQELVISGFDPSTSAKLPALPQTGLLSNGTLSDVEKGFPLHNHKQMRFQYFSHVWMDMNFGLIFYGRESFRELCEFTEELLLYVKYNCLSRDHHGRQRNEGHRAAGIYLLYSLYFKQPILRRIRISLTLEECLDFDDFISIRRENTDWDVVFVWTKLLSDHAFHFSAEGRPLGFEVALALEHRTREKTEVFQAREVSAFLTPEFQTAIQDLGNIENAYQAMKRALSSNTGSSSSEDPGLNLCKAGLAERLKKLADNAVRQGYWRDPFLEHVHPFRGYEIRGFGDSGPPHSRKPSLGGGGSIMNNASSTITDSGGNTYNVPRPPQGPGMMLKRKHPERKAPEIHLGYYTRVQGISQALASSLAVFSAHSKPAQVISLGAGSDTLFWRLKEGHPDVAKSIKTFVEIDLPGVTVGKVEAIKKSKLLMEKVMSEDGEIKVSQTDLHGSEYHLVAANFTDVSAVEKKLRECGINFSIPTVFLAECVLVYVPDKAVKDFLSWLSSQFTSALVFINHEQLHMFDRFGQVMTENLTSRGCELPGVAACKDKEAQVSRFLSTGWSSAQCWTLNEVFELLPREEDVYRVERLELFDEHELMNQLFEHYCVTVAWQNQDRIILDDVEFW